MKAKIYWRVCGIVSIATSDAGRGAGEGREAYMTDKNLPLFPQNELPKSHLAPNEILNFTTAVLGLVSATIFYIAGWVYEANWYAFYGISLTQINFQPQQIMVEGIPGVFLIGISFIVVIVSHIVRVVIFKDKTRTISTNKNFINLDPGDILYTYFLAAIYGVSFITTNKQFLEPFPIELIVSSIGVVLVIVTMFAVRIMVNVRDTFLRVVLAGLMLIVLLPIQIFLYTGIQPDNILTLMESFINILSASFVIADNSISLLQKKLEKNPKYTSFISTTQARFDSALHELKASSRLWTVVFFLFLFFLSVGLSAVLGRIDASYGRRLMLGGWHLDKVYIFSNSIELPIMQKDKNENHQYGPLGLLYSDDQSFFLVDLMKDERYVSRPNLYVIPRSNDSNYTVLFAPAAPTITLTPLPTFTKTPTPTKILTSVITPTP